MNLTLDTHVLLWWLENDPVLGKGARTAIMDDRNIVIVSAAVVWEIRIKQALGKLQIDPSFLEVIRDQGFELLPVTADHAYAVGDLPMHHRDPFDRLIIAQALLEGLTVVTRDPLVTKYEVPVIF
jgi:PIN domain nuclease of toxin-antitoxin system